MLRSRIAPTPSGFIHIGNAYNFVLTWLLTRKENGHLLLRIDDLDAPRIREEYIEDIFHSLEWLGIDWDEGPESIEDLYNIYSQRFRVEYYDHLLNEFISKEKVFACTCSRKDVHLTNEIKQYSGTCRDKNLPLDAPDLSLRLLTPENTFIEVKNTNGTTSEIDLHALIRDPVLRRKDGIPAYHIASLCDDIRNEISLIVRGEDLLPSTALHLYMANIIGNTSFRYCKFHHHELLKDENGNKLSKSEGSISLKSMREKSASPEEFYQWMSEKMELPVCNSAQELLVEFTRINP